MSKLGLIHIFTPGRQTAMCGRALDFSEADLEACARVYDPAKHEAPITVGHPKHDAPAYGWIRSLSFSEQGLQAEADQVDADFAELVREGRYKKVSASFYLPDSPSNPVPGQLYLRHVAFLGAQPPAVKGLKAVEFGEAEEGVVEFGDYGHEMGASMWRRLREFLIRKFGQAEADEVAPDYLIESIREAGRDDGRRAAFAESPTHPAKEESHVTPEEKAALEAENAQLKQQLAEASAREVARAQEKRHGEHVAYAEQLITEGRLAPKHRDAVVAFLDFAAAENEAGQVVEFGEGENKQALADAFKGFLGELPKVVEFGETATKAKAAGDQADETVDYGENVNADRLAQDRKIREHMREHGVDYATAARQVIK